MDRVHPARALHRRFWEALAATLLLVLAQSSAAQTGPVEKATMLSLSARSERTLPRDRLRAELRVEARGSDPKKLQAEVNHRMEAALTRAKQVAGVALETTGYSVFQERSERASDWRASQGLRLTARDFAALLSLVASLQEDGLLISGLSAELSPEAMKKVQDELTNEALLELKERALHIAQALGTRVEQIRDLRVGNVTTDLNPRPLAAMASGSLASSPPVAEPGDAIVSITAEATIALAPAR
jgi:predicted secreted protein